MDCLLCLSWGAYLFATSRFTTHIAHADCLYIRSAYTSPQTLSSSLSLSLSYGHAVHAHLHDPLCARSVRASARIRSAHTALLQASTRFRRMPRWPQ